MKILFISEYDECYFFSAKSYNTKTKKLTNVKISLEIIKGFYIEMNEDYRQNNFDDYHRDCWEKYKELAKRYDDVIMFNDGDIEVIRKKGGKNNVK